MSAAAPRPCRLFLFDLDGTLIDSLADITTALNLTLARMNLRPLAQSRVMDFVGSGLQKLIERALGETTGLTPEDDMVRRGVAWFGEEYGNHLLDRTRLFPGVREGLDRLSWARLAVVSNKPENFSRRILEGLGLGDRFYLILGGDSTPARKPDPGALRIAMEGCGASPSETVMVGDSAVDIEAGKAAGVMTCGVLGGFRPRKELEAAGCDIIVQSLIELADHFCPPPQI